MTYQRIELVPAFIFVCFTALNLLMGCDERVAVESSKEAIQLGHYYKSVLGEEYYANGFFSTNTKDSVETELWHYTRLTKPLVQYGKYSNGMPIGEWTFILNDETGYKSSWSVFKNNATRCMFSLPFAFEETIVDSSFFRLRTLNDSLGKITIIVGVTDTVIKEEKLTDFGPNSEIGLREQGYSFTSKRREIKNGATRYFFTEYFMKDSVGKNVKLYHLYGYLPSKNHFVEFTLFHDGPKDDLVKIIYNLMVASLYVNNERFFNPYIQ